MVSLGYTWFSLIVCFTFTWARLHQLDHDLHELDGLISGDEDEGEEKRLFVNKTFRTSRFNSSLRFTNRDSTSSSEPYFRLSTLQFKPLRYQVHWDLTKGVETFTGMVNISLLVRTSTSSLPIQINTLNITYLSINYLDTGEPIIVHKSYLSKSDIYLIETAENVTENRKISMFLRFTGAYQSLGIILHQTTTPISRYTFMTKFEPVFARKAFPCFDEPDMKAHFRISLKHNASLTAYSNMPLEKVIQSSDVGGDSNDNGNDGDWQISEFQESPLMTTYLVAFVVCDCTRVVSKTSQGIEVGIITLKEQSNRTDYGLSISVKCLEFFQQYLAIEYKFPKLDIFAAPQYPSFGMEHSGLIIQFHHRILYSKDGDHEVYNKEWILFTTAHEIAHQWFGNLVTLRWWEHTWLNEGFATYFATKAVEHVDPGMSAEEIFLLHRYRTSLTLDLRGIYNSWNRTVGTISTANQIAQTFSWLSYQKGGSILGMMEEFMGAENMTKLVRSYLNKFADSNVVTRDFGEHAEQYYPEINMTEFIDSWTLQSGNPIITVIHNADGTFRLTQTSSEAHKGSRTSALSYAPSFPRTDSSESLINSTIEKNSPHPFSSSSFTSNRLSNESLTTWMIPLTYKTSDGHSGLIWLTSASQEYHLCDNCSWVVFNVNKKGYYLVNYSPHQWSILIDSLNSDPESFPSTLFSGLLFDAYYLAEINLLPVDKLFALLSNVKRYSSLATIYLALAQSKVPFGAPSFGEGRYLLNQYRRDLIESIYEKISIAPSTSQEEYTKMIIRHELLEDACEMKVSDCLKDSSRYLTQWIHHGTHIPSYLQNVVFRYGMSNLNNITYWELILNNLLTGNLNGVKGTALIRGLFAMRDDSLREKAYSLLKDTEYEIEASVLIETKCPTLSTKSNPLKRSVLSWLIDYNSYGFPWRYEKNLIPLNSNSQQQTSLSENQIYTLSFNQPTHGPTIQPIHYSLSLNLQSLPGPPDFNSKPSNLLLKGTSQLTFKVNDATIKFCPLLIGTSLTINSVNVIHTNSLVKQMIQNTFHHRRHNLFIIEFQTPLEPGNYSIHLTHSGTFSPLNTTTFSSSESIASPKQNQDPNQIELKGGSNLFPIFNSSLSLASSLNMNLVYRLNSDAPLVPHSAFLTSSSPSSFQSSSHVQGPTIIHSASTIFSQVLPSSLRFYLSPQNVRLTRFPLNDTQLPLENSI